MTATLDMPLLTPTITPTQRTAPTPDQVLDAVEAFLAAHEAAEEARAGLTRGQESGPDAVPAGVECLLAEAQHRYEQLLRLTGLDATIPAVLTKDMSDAEIDAILSATSGYSSRPKVVNTSPTTATDWRDSVGTCDWSQGRGETPVVS